MSRRAAEALLKQHGGEIVANLADGPTLVVVGDETADWRALVGGATLREHVFQVVTESELWRRLGLVTDNDEDDSASPRHYTPAMLAELVGAPVAAIRRWVRRGYLQPSREVGRLAYLPMAEVHVARTLAGLLSEGCSLARIDKLVAQLTAAAPDAERPLIDVALIVQGARFYFRRGADLAEPSGQLLLDFDGAAATADDPPPAIEFPAIAQRPRRADSAADAAAPTVSAEAARAVALDRQAEGDLDGAIEACRAALLVGGEAEDHFLLAELLYRAGDLSAARERYYAALEWDEADVEARVNLGCVLAELGEADLAIAAFQGAIDQQADFADAHYHLARTLDDADQADAAAIHWRAFLRIAPASPWRDEAEDRLDTGHDE